MTANVMLARCTEHKKLFGIRIEKREGDWVRTWAFPIDEARAKNEGFDKTEISGSLKPAAEYPGCPYCKNIFLLQCTCGKMLCCQNPASKLKSKEQANDENSQAQEEFSVCCEWCGEVTKEFEYSDAFSVDSGEY